MTKCMLSTNGYIVNIEVQFSPAEYAIFISALKAMAKDENCNSTDREIIKRMLKGEE